MSSRRQSKIAELIQREVSLLLQRHTRDPRLGFVTITGVDVTQDLSLATVYVALLDDEKIGPTMQGLASAAGYFRYQLGQALSLRQVPTLTFKLDNSAQEGQKVESLLEKIAKERLEQGEEVNDLP